MYNVHGFKFVLTNRLNQDALENSFSVIRGRGGFRDNPNPFAFGATYRQVIVQHLLDVPKDVNCRDELATFLLGLQDVSRCRPFRGVQLENVTCSETTVFTGDDPSSHSVLSEACLNALCAENVCESNALSYVSGYVAKSVLSQHSCAVCSSFLLTQDDSCADVSNVFFEFKLFEGCSKASLHAPSHKALEIFCECRKIFVDNFEKVISASGILKKFGSCEH